MADLPTSKTAFETELLQARARLWAFINGLTPEQFTAHSDPAGWTIRDHLYHLAMWEWGIVALLRREGRWEAMGLEPQFVRSNEFDAINEKLRQAGKDLSTQETLDLLRRVQDDFDRAIAPMSDGDILKTYDEFTTEQRDPNDKRPILLWLVSDSSRHYEEHLPWMAALVNPSNVETEGS
jgi:uncharacterized damage-inducible protein DinB